MKVTVELDTLLAARKIDLVYERGSLGLKGTVTVSVNIDDSKVLGVILKALGEKRYVTGMTISNTLQVLSMHERITYMNHNADAYLVLSEGLETLEDVFNITSWAEFNIHKKPLGLLNINSFYDGLLSFLDHAME